MKKNKLILFDWGNIVESHQTGYTCYDAWRDLFIKLGYTKECEPFKDINKYQPSCIKNEEEFKEAYTLMKEEFTFNKSFDEFKKIYKDTFDKIDYYKDVADYERSLKDKCFIGIFSNLTIFDKERLDYQVGLSKYDYVFLSYNYGLRKPDIRLYEIIKDKLPFDSKDILFIDDRADNIETANKIGWNTFQITGLELDKIKEKCEEFINKD